ncbi:hypothetical protein StoSoilB13_28830 (plasmid) [Arthrobacter sp. StoSoilB13]|nr:hypothetical protein StoSoilB13_28830 [Arthrobacter sp. StoSoilB13]
MCVVSPRLSGARSKHRTQIISGNQFHDQESLRRAGSSGVHTGVVNMHQTGVIESCQQPHLCLLALLETLVA